jgi:hypothetical protein
MMKHKEMPMNREVKILDRLIAKHAIIIAQSAHSDRYIAVPYGDKRRRPISWIEPEMLQQFLAQGVVQQKGDTYIIVDSYKRRRKAAHLHGAASQTANQHRKLETRHMYNPDNIKRRVSVNMGMSIFKRLSTQLDTRGQPYLSADEAEAGEIFSRDYGRLYGGVLGTQSYADMPRTGGRTRNVAEDMSINMIDAKRRSHEALKYVGPGLDQTLIALCGREWGLERLEAEQGWPKRSGKAILKLALCRLSVFYGCKPGVKPHGQNNEV